MVIPSQIKTKYVRTGPGKVAETLHIHVGDEFTVDKGDTIILHRNKLNRIEIKRKESSVPPGFTPYYA